VNLRRDILQMQHQSGEVLILGILSEGFYRNPDSAARKGAVLAKTALMPENRFAEIEKNLRILREQQVALEQEALTYTGLPKIRAEQQIREEIKPKIQAFEQEYWQLLATRANGLEIPEPEAEVIVAEIVEQVGQLEGQHPASYPDEVIQIWQDIRDSLNKPNQPAAAKLKGIISAVPPFINLSYEAELDTEAFFIKYFPTFTRAVRALAKK
jgi:hypothetical protein